MGKTLPVVPFLVKFKHLKIFTILKSAGSAFHKVNLVEGVYVMLM